MFCFYIYIIYPFVSKINRYFLIFIIFFLIVTVCFIPLSLFILYTLTFQKSTLFYKKSKLFFSKLDTLSVTARCDMHFSCWDGAFEDAPLRTLGAVTTYIASASYGLPYLLANAQSDSVPRVGALALSVAMLFTFQGARCAGCEPLTFIVFVLSSSLILLIL